MVLNILEMSRSCSYSMSSSSNEDYHRLRRTRSKEDIDERRQAWLIQQEREREHEIRKQKMILEYELKRAAILSSSKEHSGRLCDKNKKGSRSTSSDHKIRDHKKQSPSEAIVMSQK